MSLFSSISQTILKIGTGIFTGSVSLLSDGIHSLLDVVSSVIAFYSVREAAKPADRDHPFGHGKIETLSALSESLLLVLAALFIVIEACSRWFHPQPIVNEKAAFVVLIVCVALSIFAYQHNKKAAVVTGSIAIEVNALHFLSDVVSTVAILIGLWLIQLTGWQWLDPILAFGVAIYIFAISAKKIKTAVLELIDTKLPEQDLGEIQKILNPFLARAMGIHDLRTRKHGKDRHIDFHLVVCGKFSVSESHVICDEMEEALQTKFQNTSVNIHVEPCEHQKIDCSKACSYELKKRDHL